MKAVLCALVLALPLCVAAEDPPPPEFRAVWVDAWGAGFLNQSQVDKLLGIPGNPNSKGDIRNANLNAVVVQVRRRADVCYPSGMGEPYFSGLSPADFNALQAIIDAAHDTTGGKQRIEVHAWIVVFATASGSSVSPIYYQHNNPLDPENYWVTLDNNGNETSDKAFDPGHPRALKYLVDVCMDLVTNFDIDGLHYDYIRFTANNQGYNPTSIARYNARYGLTGSPAPTDEQFKQWRRDQITAFVRQVYARVQAVKPHVKVSGAFVTWNPSPTASTRAAFMNTRPYYDVYCDWDGWLQEGIIDLAIPMNYYNWASYPNDYVRWMNFIKDRKFNRHTVVGPGIYLNSLDNAINQILMTRDPSPAGNRCQGFCGYSYRVPYSGGTWSIFSPRLVADVTPTPVEIPPMPWKTAPTSGHISGTVTLAPSGSWADGALVTISGPENRSMRCDGTGFYAFIDLTPGLYTVTASMPGYPNAQTVVNVQLGAVTGNMYVTDLALGATAPQISDVQITEVTPNSARISWTTSAPADGRVQYGLSSAYGSEAVSSAFGTSHSVVLTGLTPLTTYHLRCVSSNAYGTAYSGNLQFTTAGVEIIVDNTDPGWTNTSPGGNTWSVGSLAEVPKIGINYLYRAGDGSLIESSITRKCRWTPDLPVTGLYDVYVFYQMGSNRNTAAPYKVVYNGGELTSIQNQYTTLSNQGGWFLIGSNLPFAAGTSGYVELTTLSLDTKLVSADAAKWVLKPDVTAPAILSVNVEPSIAAGGDTITVTAQVTDDLGTVSVTANGQPLALVSGTLWAGTITADSNVGLHTVVVQARDAANNTRIDSSASYTTGRVFGITGRSLGDSPATTLPNSLFKTWGRVVRIDDNRFLIRDGSGASLEVHCANHGLATGDFAVVRGIWRGTLSPPVLECRPEHVVRVQ